MGWKEKIKSALVSWGISITTPLGEDDEIRPAPDTDPHMNDFGDPLDGGYHNPGYVPPSAKPLQDSPKEFKKINPSYDVHFKPLPLRRRRRR